MDIINCSSLLGEPIGCAALPNACPNAEYDGVPCKEKTPNMDEHELMESIKAEEQVKGASGADPNSCLGAYICLLSQKAFATMSFRVLPILEGAGGSMAT